MNSRTLLLLYFELLRAVICEVFLWDASVFGIYLGWVHISFVVITPSENIFGRVKDAGRTHNCWVVPVFDPTILIGTVGLSLPHAAD